jgi:hypothetical protein
MDDEEDTLGELHRGRRLLDDVAQAATAARRKLLGVEGEAQAARDDP